MGVNKNGLISMLTNYRDLRNLKADAPSRGHLVSDFLIEEPPSAAYLKEIEQKAEAYNGFNIICGTADELHYYGNYQSGVHEVTDGIHGLSNALLNTDWPKVERGKSKLANVIDNKHINTESLFELLYDDMKANAEQLPDTGIGFEKEKELSPIFIKSPNYGSRCSTLLLVDHKGNHTYVERTYHVQDYSYTDRLFQITGQ